MQEIFYKPYKAMCADAVERTAYVRSYWDGRNWCMHGDTYFSVPAYVKVKGTSVRGYVSYSEDQLLFHAYLYRKNHALIVPLAPSVPAAHV